MACPGVTCFTEAHIGKNMFFLSEMIRSRALIFGMKHHLVDLYQVSLTYAPGAKKDPAQVSPGTWSAFNRYLYISFKEISGE